MPKMKWGLSGDPGDIEAREVYDGPTPPKGIYITALTRLQVKENKNEDNMFSGLLVIRDPRKGKSKFNGYAIWFNRNITEQSAKHVKNFVVSGLGVPMKDLKALDNLVVLDDKDLPANVVSIGKVKIDKEPLMVVVVKRRRQNDDPEGDWELVTDDFAPAFPGIDPKKLAAKKSQDEDEDEEDEDEEDDEPDDEDVFGDDEDEDEEDDEEDEEDQLTREELSQMGLAELRELAIEQEVASKAKAAKLKKTALVDLLAPEEDEDEEDEDEDEDEEEEEEAPPPKKTTKKSKRSRK